MVGIMRAIRARPAGTVISRATAMVTPRAGMKGVRTILTIIKARTGDRPLVAMSNGWGRCRRSRMPIAMDTRMASERVTRARIPAGGMVTEIGIVADTT